MRRRKVMRGVETIRRFQRLADENRLVEVAMSFRDAKNLMELLHNAVRNSPFSDDLIVLHYLSAKKNRPSLISPQIELQRASALIAVETTEMPDDDKFDLDFKELEQQLVDFQNAIDDI